MTNETTFSFDIPSNLYENAFHYNLPSPRGSLRRAQPRRG